MTSCSLVRPTAARCERPTAASFRAAKFHPGRLVQGPEEKQGFCGLTTGLVIYSVRASIPPSTVKEVPVMKDASSEARNSTALAMSSPVPKRWAGTIWA